MRGLLMIFVFLFIGCAKGGDAPVAAASDKSLWSAWTRTDGALAVNLSGGSLGVSQAFGWQFANGAICTCNLVMTGTEASGNWTLSSCSYASGGSGDPGCASLNQSGTFSKDGSTLNLCNPSCGIYQ